jgi:hypothetical protein
MIKFFRAIRQKSLAQNNIVRYLLYATGEIVLVVIGILIALAITDWNETRKKEQKIQLVFEDILLDLASDITSTNNLMQYYEEKDTLIYLVLYGNLTTEDYYSYKMPGLWGLTGDYFGVDLTQNGYNNLIQDLDAIPLKYKPIIKELNELYGRRKNSLVYYNTQMREMIDSNVKESSHEEGGIDLGDSLAMVQGIQRNYFTNKYRQEVKMYNYNGLRNHLLLALDYRSNAIECYKKIAPLLNKPPIDKSFELDADVLKIVVGDWKLEGYIEPKGFVKEDSDHVMTIYKEENKLFFKYNLNRVDTVETIKGEMYISSKTKLRLRDRGVYISLIKDSTTYRLNDDGQIYVKINK